jgi:SOS-response transcriptional repressor LexA
VGVLGVSKDEMDFLVAYVRDYCAEHGYSPTWREMADALGCSLNKVSHIAHRLREQGRISFVDGQPRTIRVAP